MSPNSQQNAIIFTKESGEAIKRGKKKKRVPFNRLKKYRDWKNEKKTTITFEGLKSMKIAIEICVIINKRRWRVQVCMWTIFTAKFRALILDTLTAQTQNLVGNLP